MRWEPRYTKEAEEDLRSVSPHIARRITDKIFAWCESGHPMFFAKPLHGLGEKLFRFRIGEYRAIFLLNRTGEPTILLIVTVGHRKDIYEDYQ